jgi:hypothetical protein
MSLFLDVSEKLHELPSSNISFVVFVPWRLTGAYSITVVLRYTDIIHPSDTLMLDLNYLLRHHVSILGSLGSSVSIVSGYGLDDRVIEVRSPAGAEDFSSSLCVQTDSGAHPASYTIGARGPFPGGKAQPGRDADHSSPSSVEVVNE